MSSTGPELTPVSKQSAHRWYQLWGGRLLLLPLGLQLPSIGHHCT